MSPEWFVTEQGHIICAAYLALQKKGVAVNMNSLRDYLTDNGLLEQAGGPEVFGILNHSWSVTQSATESINNAYQLRKVSEILSKADKEGNSAAEVIERLKPFADLEKSENLFKAFSKAAIPFPNLKDLGIPHRRKIIGEWFCESDLCFVFAPRGLGKTWFSLGLAAAISGKATFGPWKVHESTPVLYVDGEMPCESLQQRISGMGADDDLIVLNHESLFHLTGKVLNLTNPEAQDSITRICQSQGIKVVILDNLSCLFSGIKENEADAWEAVLPWLLSLRRHRIAVVIVAHSGRDGKNMRGTSRREDAAFSVIRLDEVAGSDLKDGARFIARFTKDRNSPSEQSPFEWTFQTESDGNVKITTKIADGLAVLIEWVRDGLSSAEDIAREMGITKGTVSKMAKRAIESGRLRKEGRGYALA